MKGILDAKGISATSRKRPVVNEGLWARETVANQECQDRVDVKAFTGRGNLLVLRHWVDRLAEIESAMKALSDASKSLEGCYPYLMVHHRPLSGYMFLRWRERTGKKRHLSWEEVETLLLNMPHGIRRWCRQASSIANELNAKHLAAREEIKRIRRSVAQSVPHLFPRTIPMRQA